MEINLRVRRNFTKDISMQINYSLTILLKQTMLMARMIKQHILTSIFYGSNLVYSYTRIKAHQTTENCKNSKLNSRIQ